MRQVGLVTFYEMKPKDFSALITECQERATNILEDDFQPYSIRQVHATFVSLERVPNSPMLNLNLKKYRGQYERMDFFGLLNFIRTSGRFPFRVQIGGFQNRDYSFVSQGQRPYKRSFSIVDDKVVLMGWPVCSEPSTSRQTDTLNLIQEGRFYPLVLDEVRRALQAFNILHSYHCKPTDVDNDFYFRIGLTHRLSLDDPRRERVASSIRQFLSERNPLFLDVTLSVIYVVSYEEETLPLHSTQVWPITDNRVTSEFISDLYR